MAWWLRTMAALLKDQVPFPVPIWLLTTFCNSSSDGSMLPSGLCGYCLHVLHRYMLAEHAYTRNERYIYIYKLRAAREGGGHGL